MDRAARGARFALLAWAGLLAAAVCAAQASAQHVVQATQSAAQDARQAQRARILDTARRYAEFEWRGDERHVLHGPDRDGTPVDTPDASFDERGWRTDGSANRGLPYAWGGFTSIDEFELGLAQGLPAGHVPTTERAQPSRFALGLDCSGYVARCWDLPVKQSTRSLGALCYPLADYEALEPGDILNLFDSHVVLFDRWLDEAHTRLSVFEAARLAVVASEYTVEQLQGGGFLPMRYKPLDERWVPMDLQHVAFAVPASPDAASAVGRFEAESEAESEASAALAAVASPLADARPLEWARYRVTGEDPLAEDGFECATLVATAQGPVVELQTDTVLLGQTLSTGSRCEQADVLLEALLDFAVSDEPLSAVTLDAATVTRGSYVLAGRRFAAHRIEAQLSATRVMRHQDYPVTLTLDVVLSPEVPVHGVLEASVRQETVWRAQPPEQRSVSRKLARFQLREFGGVGTP